MPALTAPACGNGTTVSGMGLTTLVRSVSGPTDTIGMFETTDLSTTEYKTFKKNCVGEPGKLTVEVFWTGAAITLGATGTFTLTYPSAGNYSGTAIITSVKYPDANANEPLVGSYEISFDGYTGPAFTAA